MSRHNRALLRDYGLLSSHRTKNGGSTVLPPLVSCDATAPYSAVQPPSIERFVPVICAASSPQRNSASAATCSEVTNSLVGCAASNTSLITCSLVRLRAFIVSGI